MLDKLHPKDPVPVEAQRLPEKRAHFGAMLSTLHKAGFVWELNSMSGRHRLKLAKSGLSVEGTGATAEDAIRDAAARYDAEASRSIRAETAHIPLPTAPRALRGPVITYDADYIRRAQKALRDGDVE